MPHTRHLSHHPQRKPQCNATHTIAPYLCHCTHSATVPPYPVCIAFHHSNPYRLCSTRQHLPHHLHRDPQSYATHTLAPYPVCIAFLFGSPHRLCFRRRHLQLHPHKNPQSHTTHTVALYPCCGILPRLFMKALLHMPTYSAPSAQRALELHDTHTESSFPTDNATVPMYPVPVCVTLLLGSPCRLCLTCHITVPSVLHMLPQVSLKILAAHANPPYPCQNMCCFLS